MLDYIWSSQCAAERSVKVDVRNMGQKGTICFLILVEGASQA